MENTKLRLELCAKLYSSILYFLQKPKTQNCVDFFGNGAKTAWELSKVEVIKSESCHKQKLQKVKIVTSEECRK